PTTARLRRSRRRGWSAPRPRRSGGSLARPRGQRRDPAELRHVLHELLLHDGARERRLGHLELPFELALALRFAAVPKRGLDARERVGAPALDGLLPDAVLERELVHGGLAGQQRQHRLGALLHRPTPRSTSHGALTHLPLGLLLVLAHVVHLARTAGGLSHAGVSNSGWGTE